MDDASKSYDTTEMKMPRYKCYKEVWALQIDTIQYDSEMAIEEGRESDGSATITPVEEGYGPFRVNYTYVQKHDPQPGGYYVVYKGGYKSFSPAKAFEGGYTKIQ